MKTALLAALAALAFVGCGEPATPSPANPSPAKAPAETSSDATPEDELLAYKRKAALDLLTEFVSKSRGHMSGYIERSPYLPSDLSRIGDYDFELVSREELQQRYAGARDAPGMVSLRVYHEEGEPESHFHVSIDDGAVMIDGAESWPGGHGFDYQLRIVDGNIEIKDVIEIHFD